MAKGKRGSASKGSTYEREICKKLSLWWTDDARDDVFWRSSGSGARAKTRGRAGRNTYGQHGDITATDPIGSPLIDTFTIEIKRGYSQYTMQDLMDSPANSGIQMWEDFFAQTVESYEQAGSASWLLITKRDRRRALVWFPWRTYTGLRRAGAFMLGTPRPFMRMRVMVRNRETKGRYAVDCCGMPLEDWLMEVSPAMIRENIGAE